MPGRHPQPVDSLWISLGFDPVLPERHLDVHLCTFPRSEAVSGAENVHYLVHSICTGPPGCALGAPQELTYRAKTVSVARVIAMKTSRTYDLGPVPRPAGVQFTYQDGRKSAVYALADPVLVVPDGVLAAEIRQFPIYPVDWPAADEPGWGNDAGAPLDLPGEGATTRAEVRGPERFRKSAR